MTLKSIAVFGGKVSLSWEDGIMEDDRSLSWQDGYCLSICWESQDDFAGSWSEDWL